MLLWLTLAVTCCLSAQAQPQYGGPVQFGPPPSRGAPVQRGQSAFQAPRFVAAGPVFSAPQGFRPAPVHDNNELGHSTPSPLSQATPARSALRVASPAPQQPQAFYSPAPQYNPTPAPQVRRPAPPPPQQPSRSSYNQKASPSNRGAQRATPQILEEEFDEDELEEQKPDRLTELLPLSKFSCGGKTTGYYADQDVGCEVFHYCQDGAKHSWVCPDGFTFHQVHLICMPPAHDNNCQKASEFFFVNDYLYRPLNAEEARTRPNVTLRYSDRYYPESDPEHTGFIDPDDRPRPQAPARGRQPAPNSRNQVFHSPESVNIPLQQRRVPVTPAPTRQQIQDDEYEYDDFPYRQG